MALGTMYPGKINSPATLITSTIDDSTTVIPVAELACFPDAPNLAVIGTGDDAETILYATRSATSGAGNLTGVTRGFQGTAAAWSSTESIARNFTAYDFDTLSTNLFELSTVYAPVSGSTVYVPGQSTDFVGGTSTQFMLYGTSTDFAPITGSTVYVSGQSTDYVAGTSTQFMLYGTSTDFAPVTGSTEYAPGTSTNYAPFTFAIDSTVYHTAGSDITDYNVSTLLHGFVPKLLGTSSKFLSSTGGWMEPEGGAGTGTTTHALDSTSIHTLSDSTIFNASTLMHGFLLKLNGASSYYLASNGEWSEPPAVAGSTDYAPITGSTNYVSGQSSDYVSGTSTQFSIWGSSTDYAPITGSTNYVSGQSTDYVSGTSTQFSVWGSSTDYAPITGSTVYVPGQSTDFVPGQSTDFVSGTSTQFTLWGSSTNYAPITGSTNYVAGQSTDFVSGTSTQFTLWGSSTDYAPITGSTNYVAGQTTDFVSGTSTQFSPLLVNKTITLYAGNAMIATTTDATLGLQITTENNVYYTYGEFTTVPGELMQWGVQLDPGWNSSNLYATFNWTMKTSQAGDVIWNLAGYRLGDNSTMNTALAAVITSTDTYQGSSTCYTMHRSAETTNFVVTGAGNYITFQLTRGSTDTLSTAARIISVEVKGLYASTY